MARTRRLDRSRKNPPAKRRRIHLTSPPIPAMDDDSSDNDSFVDTATVAALQVSPAPESGVAGGNLNDSRKLLESLSPEQIQRMLEVANNSTPSPVNWNQPVAACCTY